MEHVGQHRISTPTSLSFRMSVSDFRQNFEIMEVCHQTEAFRSSSVQPWSCSMHHGSWVSSITAGGPPIGRKRRSTVAKNLFMSIAYFRSSANVNILVVSPNKDT